MLLADIADTKTSAGAILIVAGLVAIAATSVTIRNLHLDLDVRSRWITRLAGTVVGLAGLFLVLTDSDQPADAQPPKEDTTTTGQTASSLEESTTTTTTVPELAANEIEIDHPTASESVTVTCEAPDVCTVPASGRVGEETDEGLHAYLLIAGDVVDGEPNYYVQYDSTVHTGTSWTARAYVEDVGPGETLIMQAVLVRGTIAPPSDDSGLLWTTAKQLQNLEVVDESEPVQAPVQ